MNKFDEFRKRFISKWHKKDMPDSIYIEWTVGGLTGGSCWGSSADHAVNAEEEPAFIELDTILEELCPQITFLQYKNLCNNLIETTKYTENQYYGNYYNKRIKSINLGELEKYLKERNLWNEDAP